MYPQWAALAMSAAVAIQATVAKPLAPPTTGWLYNFTDALYIFPLTATQCEPFYIFYNTTVDGDTLFFADAAISKLLFAIDFIPKGIGYLEWICNIPAGIPFHVGQNYVVQAGSSSACLGDLTTTYSHLSYATTDFESFTRTASPFITSLTTYSNPTVPFPTGPFPTITLNPNLAVTPTTSPPSSSLPPSPSLTVTSPPSTPPLSPPAVSSSPTPSHQSRNAAVAGGVVGTVAFVILVVALVLWRRRRSLITASLPILSPQLSQD